MPRLFSAKVVFYLLFLLLLEMSVLPALADVFPRPALLYLFVLFVAFEWHWKKTIPAAILIGLMRDLVTMQPLGTETFALFFTALGLHLYVQKIQTGWMPAKMLGAFLFVAAVHLLSLSLTSLASKTFLIHGEILRQVFLSSLASAAVAPFFFYLSQRIFLRQGSSFSPYYE